MIEFDSVAILPVADAVGTVGYTVLNLNGGEIIPRTTSGIARLFEGSDYGIYAAHVVLGDEVDDCTVVWDDDAGNAVARNATDFDFLADGAFLSAASLPILAGEGAVGYTLYTADGDEIAERSTIGVSQIYEGDDYGIYQAAVAEPEYDDHGIVVWDDGAGNAVARPFAVGAAADQNTDEPTDVKTLRVVVIESGALVELDAPPTLTNPSNSYGVIRLDSGETVLGAGAQYSDLGGGLYQRSFAEPEADLLYRYYVRIEHGDAVYFLPRTTAYITSSALVIGRYTDSTRIEQQFGIENVHKWLGVDDSDAAIDYGLRLYAFIAAAENEIDDKLRSSGIDIPEVIPETIQRIATLLAGVRSYEARGVVDMNPETGAPEHRLAYQRKEAERLLAQLQLGAIRLAGDELTRHPKVLCDDETLLRKSRRYPYPSAICDDE